MLTRRYPRFTGEYFTYSYALVFTNRFWTLIMSGILVRRLDYGYPCFGNAVAHRVFRLLICCLLRSTRLLHSSGSI